MKIIEKLFKRIDFFLHKGLYNRAREICHIVIKLSPNHNRIMSKHKEITTREQEHKSILSKYKSLKNITKENINTRYEVGLELEKFGEYQKTLGIYEKILTTDASSKYIYSDLGNLYLTLGKEEMSEKTFVSGINKNPKDHLVFYNYGRFLYEKKDFKKAIKYYKKAIDNNSKHENSYFNIALCFKALKEYESALKYLKELTLLNSLDFEAFEEMAKIFEERGNYENAYIMYNQIYLNELEK